MDYELGVDRFDLLEGLKRFRTRRRIRPSERAVFGFNGRFFSIEALDKVVVSKANGAWPGIASVSASVVVALAMAPPNGDPVVIACDGERVRLGTLTVGCTWQPVSHTLSKLPAAPDWIEALSFKYRASRAQIVAGGYEPVIAEAERQLTRLIARVAKPLAPLGVTEKDVRSLIERTMEERYTGHT